ncbi:unnamed protein product [Prorocentrum cordatum]|uniref:Ornithine aminotransferase n=1 Tax=Prorocentrum cordatum TaxID=2364126 RepID=A0ABN9WHC1_9DINO|nr:unnamed protein product [Polarella glacialis]|mmetsp:Transcript_90855/g.236712  ORF Transcript_90855/g.236712 Transcript_90855/m.236712 type:complete len:421 (-) Transcript_90855:26-1288(-)
MVADVKIEKALNPDQQHFIDTESEFGAHNYHPLPVVLEKGERCYMWDTGGKKYFDFLAAYSAVNQGHCHPKIVKAMMDQCQKLTLTSRAFHNDVFAGYCKFVTEFFGYEKVLPMNTGVEGTETAIKLMRRWGYMKRGVAPNRAQIVFANDNFWGRSIAAVSTSTDPDCYEGFGPYAPGFIMVPFNDVHALEKAFAEDPNIVGVCYEPIQGEAGIKVPDPDFFRQVKALCEKHNALLCCDEIQTGLCRTGKMLCSEHYGIRPDIVVLGKALSGGLYPVSAVLTDKHVMDTITPGTHGSTYGGNPLACRVAIAALEVLKEENMADNAQKLGEIFRAELGTMQGKYPWIKDIRGKGLLNAIECDPAFSEKVTAWQVCIRMAENGLLAKPTHDNIIRFAPPLCINEEELRAALKIIMDTFAEFA